MRQYCLSYLTPSPSKLIDNFQRLKKDFSEVMERGKTEGDSDREEWRVGGRDREGGSVHSI